MEAAKYDPRWLVELALQQFPGEPWLAAALEKCTTIVDRDGEILFFVDRMEGKFKQNVNLLDPTKGRVVLDLLVDGRVGALEILGTPFAPDSFEIN
ncbi:MAG: hypothetical protein IT290_11410 [Deltaproteobacteria bacterium]|nr:hypothetical protein [Deltaproteobacteria bacterium]